MAAARAGAACVTACEGDGELAAVAAACVARNGLADVVTVRHCHSTALARRGLAGGERVQLVSHEVLDSLLLGEGVLPALRCVRRRRPSAASQCDAPSRVLPFIAPAS